MNTQHTLPIKYLKQDADGNIYAIPEKEEQAFTMAMEAIHNEVCGSDEWMRLTDELNRNYGQYLRA